MAGSYLRTVGGTARTSFLDDDDVGEVFNRLAGHYGTSVLPVRTKREREGLQHAADAIGRFSSLALTTTESLAYVYENTRLVRRSKRKIFLILDNLRVHHSKPVKKWLAVEEHKKKIEVFYLPSYSPELNLDELPNADLKRRVTTAAPARTAKALTRTAVSSLRGIQKQPARIQSYFQQKDVSHAA